MAFVLVVDKKGFSRADLKVVFDKLELSHNLLYENSKELDQSPLWGDCSLLAVDIRAPFFPDQRSFFHHLVVDLLAELPELLAYCYHPLVDVEDLTEEHLLSKHFRVAWPF